VNKNTIQKLGNNKPLLKGNASIINDSFNSDITTYHSLLIKTIALANKELTASNDGLTSLNNIFKSIGDLTESDQIIYFDFQYLKADKPFKINTLWNRNVDEREINTTRYQNLIYRIYKLYHKNITAREIIHLNASETSYSSIKTLMNIQSIKSALILPIYSIENLFGLITIFHNKHEKSWTSTELLCFDLIAASVSQYKKRKEINELLSQTYRQAGIGTWQIHFKGDYIYYSTIAKEILHISTNEKICRETAFKRFKNKSDIEWVKSAIERSLETGDAFEKIVELLTQNGGHKWIKVIGEVKYKNKIPISIQGTIQDITEQKKAEVEAEKNKQLLDTIFNQAVVSIFVRKINGEILYVNPTWKKIFGLEDIDIQGKNLLELFDNDFANQLIHSDQSVFRSGKQKLLKKIFKPQTVNVIIQSISFL
jgi:PAS domain S-box-containing protein